MAAGDLTSLQSVRLYLDIKTDTDDALLSRLITAASVFIVNYLNRNTILQASYANERHNGHGGQSLTLRNTPIQSVASLTVNGLVVAASPDGVLPGYVFDKSSIAYVGGVFPKGFSNVVVSYAAGYASVPYDIEEACVELVALHYREKSRVGKKSDAMPQGGTTTYSEEALSPRGKATLSNYRRMVPV
jgi:hypothetical protein